MSALATTNGGGFDETMRLAEVFVRSGFFADSKDAAQAVVKIIAGGELGFGPMSSMTGVHVIKGKVALSSNLLGAAIKRSGKYDYRVMELDDTHARLVFFEGGEHIGESAFSIDDAKRAGLLSNQTWKNYPRNMLLARALSNGARWFCPDVFGGPIYTPDELGAEVDGETGDVIEHEPRRALPGNGNGATKPPNGRTQTAATAQGAPETAEAGSGEHYAKPPNDPDYDGDTLADVASEAASDEPIGDPVPAVVADARANPPDGHWTMEIERLASIEPTADALRDMCRAWPDLLAVENDFRRVGAAKKWASAIAALGGPDDLRKVRTWLGSKDWGLEGRAAVAAASTVIDGALAELDGLVSETDETGADE